MDQQLICFLHTLNELFAPHIETWKPTWKNLSFYTLAHRQTWSQNLAAPSKFFGKSNEITLKSNRGMNWRQNILSFNGKHDYRQWHQRTYVNGWGRRIKMHFLFNQLLHDVCYASLLQFCRYNIWQWWLNTIYLQNILLAINKFMQFRLVNLFFICLARPHSKRKMLAGVMLCLKDML